MGLPVANHKVFVLSGHRHPAARSTAICLLLIFGCAIGLLTAFLLAGCGQESGAAVEIDFWAMGREGEVVQELLPAFERRYPDIRVRVQQIPWSAAHEKLLTAYAGGTMPDLFQLGNTWIPEFVALGALEPLDGRAAQSAGVQMDDYFPGILATSVLAGTLYAIPWYVDTRLLFYRRDILAKAGYREPPRTWDAWLDAMQRIKAQEGAERYAILAPLNEWELPTILALQMGAGLLRDNARYGDFQSPAFCRAFEFYLDLFRQRLAPAVGATQVANLYQEFTNGYFALYLSGPWNIGEFQRRLPSTLQGQWSTAPLPAPAGETFPGVSLAGGAGLALHRASTHKEAAWKLIAYLSEPERQAEFYRLTGNLPARKSAWQVAALSEQAPTQAFWLQLQAVQAPPKIPEWERIADKIAQYAERVIRGEVSADAALAALDRDVDTILEKRRWLLR
ncbi:MAG: sugar ABC transporter substrate-binding protein [Candidatus Competibacteraceae bacterium]